MTSNLKKILLILGDVAVLYASLFLTLMIRYQSGLSEKIWDQHFWPFTVLFAVWLAIFYINGLYDLAASKNDVEFYNRIFRNLLINYAAAAAYFYLLTNRIFDIKPQVVFFIMIGVNSVLFAAWRYWYNGLVQRADYLKKILVVGMTDEARELVEEIMHKPQLGYRIAAIIHDGYRINAEIPGVKLYDSSVDLKQLLRDQQITTVVTALDPHSNPELVQHLFESLALKIQFYDLARFYEKLTGKIPVTHIGHIWFVENLAESEKGVYEFFKRLFDIGFAVVFLTITLPFVPLIAIAIKLTSSGPLFFRQVRMGMLGRQFNAIKFRSMRVGAEEEGEPQWAKHNDPRATRFGRFLRKSRIDEIPQLINVLRGEMSIIGPRPERPEFVFELQRDIPFYNERHLIKPGMTGWAQINFQYGASTADAFKKLQYDLFYVKNMSVPLDVGIELRTINIILGGKGR